jgi:hypothetical protein
MKSNRCCGSATVLRVAQGYAEAWLGSPTAMFDVYVNDKRHLLVVRKGYPIPAADAPDRWRKMRKKVTSVSDEIQLAVQNRGYYKRKVKDLKRSWPT